MPARPSIGGAVALAGDHHPTGVLAEELEQRLARVTLERIRIGFWLLLASSLLFLVADIWLAGHHTTEFLILDAVQLAVLGIAFALFRRRPGLRATILIGFSVAAILLVGAVLYGVRDDDYLTMPHLGVVFTLVSATVVPWGLAPQATLVAMAVVAGVINVYAVTGTLAPVVSYPGLTMLFAGAVSLYLARQLRANIAMQESERFAFGVLDSLSARLAILDTDGTILAVNRAWRDFADSGAAGPDGVREGASFVTACRAGGDAALKEIAGAVELVAAGKRVVVDLEHRSTLPSASRWFAVRVRPLAGPGPRRVVVAMEDCTEQRRQADAIRELNEELEQRVRERTAELEIANRELESFSYSVSHDLRAPLRAIDGFSQILLEDHAGRLEVEGRAHLQRVRGAVIHMQRLIGDFLTLARVTRQELNRARIDLSAMAESIAHELRSRQPERQVEYVVAPGVEANADPRLARVALRNLLENAWKFTSPHPTARIEFGATRERGRLVYHVRDDGVGFEMAHAGKLFRAFQRLHGAQEFEGNGAGLATVQRIIERHGGEVWAEGVEGKGATFFFTLEPRGKEENEKPAEAGC